MTEPVAAACQRHDLTAGWELAGTAPGELPDAASLHHLRWTPARVPGTVAGVLPVDDPDERDWWFRVSFAAEPAACDEQVMLVLGGMATVADVYINGELMLHSESMFAAHEIDVSDRLRGDNELAICCRALGPRLRAPRKPRARWRTKLVSAGNLRFYRTMLLGRTPGFAPGPAVVGPWRPVALERRRGPRLGLVRLRARMHGADGVLQCVARVSQAPGSELPLRLTAVVRGSTSAHRAELAVDPATGEARGEVAVPAPDPWWPHTHGRPALYDVSLAVGDRLLHRARIGFRHLQAQGDLDADGLCLRINGVDAFLRGAVWTPVDLRAPHADEATLRVVLERVAACGMNMLRVPGTAAYETAAFYDLCDELGILVWQDFMFANLDYPEQDAPFMATVEAEARQILEQVGGRPCLAVLCGGSEVAQQVAMLGLDPGLAQGPLYGQLLPRLVAEAAVEAPYLPSTPWGGELPFRPDSGVAHYYGVGAYLRPLEDARRAGVRFASECLAFANVPDDAALQALDAGGGRAVHDPAWKAGVPRDAGAGWDFDDVRDHYLALLYRIDATALRSSDLDRYLELSRAVTGEVMSEVMGEWRRGASPCAGGLVLWLKDLRPGAGWGVLDHRGEPKVAYHHLRRVLAPVAVWSTDEGLGGVVAHVANDGPEPLAARLRVSLYRDGTVLVDEAAEEVELGPHSSLQRNVETLLGRFVDVAWAYRFGPPAQDLIVLSLERDHGRETELISQSFRCPAGRPSTVRTAQELGLTAVVESTPTGAVRLRVTAHRFVDGVRIAIPGYRSADDAFGVEPGHPRVVALSPAQSATPGPGGTVTALNLSGRLRLQVPDQAPC